MQCAFGVNDVAIRCDAGKRWAVSGTGDRDDVPRVVAGRFAGCLGGSVCGYMWMTAW